MNHDTLADALEDSAAAIRSGERSRDAVVASLIETLGALEGVYFKNHTARTDGEGQLTRALEHTDAEIVFRVADLEEFPEDSDAETTLEPYITAEEFATLLEWRANRLRSEPVSDAEIAVDLIHLLASEPGAVFAERVGSRGAVWLGPEFGDHEILIAGIGAEQAGA